MAGWLDALIGGIGEAIADIRHKVVEEGWFGRAVTNDVPEAPQQSGYRDLYRSEASFEALWGVEELWMGGSDPVPLIDYSPSPERGIDL